MPIQGGDIVWTLSALDSGLEKAFAQAGARADDLQSRFGNVMKSAQVMGGAMTAVGGGIVASLGLAVKATVDLGSTLVEMSERTNMSISALSGWKFALEQSGTSIETLEGAIKRMQVGIVGGAEDAAEAHSKWQGEVDKLNFELDEMQKTMAVTADDDKYNKQVEKFYIKQKELNDLISAGPSANGSAAALEKIGLNLEALGAKDTHGQLVSIFTALRAIEDPTLQAARAMEIFGKTGNELIPLINGDLDALMAQAAEMGLMGDKFEENMRKGESFGDTLAKLQTAAQALLVSAGPIIIDFLVPFAEKSINAAASMTAWTQAHPGLTQAIVVIGGVIGGLMVTLGPLLLMLPGIVTAFSAIGPIIGVVGAAFVALTGPIGLIVVAIGGLIAAGYAIYQNWEGIKEGADVIWDGIVAAFNWGLETLGKVWEMIAAMSTDAWTTLQAVYDAGVAFVMDAFSLWVDWQQAQMDAVLAVFNWLGAGLQGVWDWITGGIQSAANFIASTVDWIISSVQNALNWIAELPAQGMEMLGFANGGVVPGFAMGGKIPAFAGGGVARPVMVGERGPEIAMLPVGTRVMSHGESMNAVRQGGGTSLSFGGIEIGNINLASSDSPRASAEKVWREISPFAIDDLSRRLEHAKRARA